jgi:hypothetical protein
MKTTGAASVALLLLTACGGGFRAMREQLPAAEADAFVGCDAFLRPKLCPATGPGGAGAAQSMCMSQIAERYTALPDAAARRAFLVDAGCPSTIVRGSQVNGRTE